MKTIIAILMLVSLEAKAAAQDQWLCTDESSQVRGESILSCGVALGRDENEARSKAFDNAKAEFNRICKATDTCNGKQVAVEPKRTACEEINGSYKCYRLLEFHIGTDKSLEHFESFTYEASSSTPKVFKGMSKKALLEAFGLPYKTNTDVLPFLQLTYKGPMCDETICFVEIENGKVYSWGSFKPTYTADLQ